MIMLQIIIWLFLIISSCLGKQLCASDIRGPKGAKGESGKCDCNMTGTASRSNEMDGLNGKEMKGERGYPGHPWGSAGCPGVVFQLPDRNQITDYVKYRGNFPYLQEGTVCMWLEIEDVSSMDQLSFFMSYHAGTEDNEWSMALSEEVESLHHFVEGQGIPKIELPHLMGREMFHLCGWFSSILGEDAVYFNGTRLASRSNSNVVRGGGSLILGQDQDNSGKFQASQSFSGNITNFMVWSRVLSDDEIQNIATNCDCPRDYSLALTMAQAELHGNARYSLYGVCPTL